jgi:hypothetical protein
MDAWFWSNVPQSQKLSWIHLTKLLGDVGHVEYVFGLIGDSANRRARYVHALH